GRRVAQAEAGQQRPDQLTDDRFGEKTADQRGQRDRDLRTGQLERQRPMGREQGFRPTVAHLLDVGLDRTALQRGERELRRDRQYGTEREQQEQQQAGDGEHYIPHTSSGQRELWHWGWPGCVPGSVLSPGERD